MHATARSVPKPQATDPRVRQRRQQALSSVWLLKTLLAGLLVLVIGLAATPPAMAASQSAPSIPSEEVRVVGRLPMQLTPAEQQEFERRTLALAKTTRERDAVVSYSCNADIEHPGTYVFDEIWPSELALKEHLATSHFKDWWAWVEPHLSGELVISLTSSENFHTLS